MGSQVATVLASGPCPLASDRRLAWKQAIPRQRVCTVIGTQKLAIPHGQTKLCPLAPDFRASALCCAAQFWHSALTFKSLGPDCLRQEAHPVGSAPSHVRGGGGNHET